MAIRSEAQKQAVQRYNSRTYDQIQIRVKKGNRELIAQKAQEMGYPDVSKLVKSAISEKIGIEIE